MKLNHLLLTVDNVEAVSHFFEEVIGLRIGNRPNFPFKGAWLYDDNNMPVIHLSQRKKLTKHSHSNILSHDDEQSEIGTVFHHVAFADDMNNRDAYIKKLESMGMNYGTTYVADRHIIQDFVVGPESIMVEIQFE